ncbi:MAG: hypothetical protein P4L39_07200 [Humidesulfovibrio sp.]|nr:hypothetical protein [Humidesulfovibrio sp.]
MKEKHMAVSGQDCPQSGVWQAVGTALPPLLVAKGDILPGAQGRVLTWVLLDLPTHESASGL